MKQFAFRVSNLVFGLLLFAFGIVLTITANIGYAPWDVFHVGIALTTGISIGAASVIVGAVIVVIAMAFKEKIGLGTICNMILIGVFIDLIFMLDIVPLASSFAVGLAILVAGVLIISIGTYFYIKSAFGAGPRDSLMVVLNRKTKLPVGVCRCIVELTATFAGWLLGGMVGIGTVIFVISIGLCIQLVFTIFKFNATAVEHETIVQTYKGLKRKN